MCLLTPGPSWDNEQRGSATAIFTLSPFAGPAIGPIVGGYLGFRWQWLFWILSIFVSSTHPSYSHHTHNSLVRPLLDLDHCRHPRNVRPGHSSQEGKESKSLNW
jgi:MFS family permease